ncbi:MAG: hypothetical protein ACK5JF_11950 [Oscillospiraceae bacterium]
MKIFKRVTILVVALFVIGVLPVSSTVWAASNSQPVHTEAKADHSHYLEWGVLVYAVGEFAGLIGTGICSMRKEKRQEKIKQAQSLKAVRSYAPYVKHGGSY